MMLEGVLVVNKPQGPTSHDVVDHLRRRLGIRRIGHAGTLDPIAEGVLVTLVGRATEYQRAVQAYPKQYETAIQLGLQTDSGDAWGKPLQTAEVPPLDRGRVAALLTSLTGPLLQTPPRFSAVKVQGRPMYWWTRRGVAKTVAPRQVEIFQMALMDVGPQTIRCRIDCSSGTYIRTLAETIAQRLGTLGHVAQLTRLAVGPWTIETAHPLSWILSAGLDELRNALQPSSTVASIAHARPHRL
ncbi:MAG TPA: tRNA pseudouridine(55) synthase TruB [Candidatus Omnitrophica bacterium]|nr:MAG: tRNA pseudouridine(55) synthase TruB [Omnitrophica WOR_2 bacterium GWA2_63_20]OGX31309.1 MAG: tRNA pseudouridine(55) synthase TruB [Omnitrophica WOR_2 bacterium RIFCSPHIGHO2_12_FULL_64_13]OGX36956.1 MAG: tRNA pseudouridine(55) synthase TruB [Omnitrophica WOR_2 bacterium RIFCSPHIGHO2_02_FULL_63_39]OGX46437.1 MAG: tRNA pseudouridine(55) synthase TruB [Omnitrophica WOR_2 bacterium RIFCSPLOWO2_02_FULL_63_16]OGX49810.1 MAG: tRNA pseudouridine(55) synthase TruB [Omnitrophica WOR_2 bacterium R